MKCNLSASIIRDFLYCPKKLYYRRHNAEQVPNSNTMSGIIVHKVLETSWRNRKQAEEAIKGLLKYYNIKSNEIRNVVINSVDNYFNLFRTVVEDDDMVEKTFYTTYVPNHGIVGKFDRVNTRTNTLIDWKVSTYDQHDINHDVQLLLYNIAYRIIYKRKLENVFHINLLTGTCNTFVFSEPIVKEFEEVLIEKVIYALDHNDFPRYGLYKKDLCENCSYNNVCDSDRLTEFFEESLL